MTPTPNFGWPQPIHNEVGWDPAMNAMILQLDGLLTSSASRIASFGMAGAVTTQVGVGRFLLPVAARVISVVMAVNTAPTGAALVCDVNKNGVTMFSTQGNRPSIAAAAFKTASAAVPDVTALALGDYLTVDVDQVGSTIAGADLVVQVLYVFT